MRPKLSIGQRLFTAALLAFALVAGAGVELVRWQFLDNFAADTPAPHDDRPDDLARRLAQRYAQARGWSFLPADAAARTSWLRSQIPAAPGAPALGERLWLQDADRRVLAGVAASPWLVALASIDTRAVPVRVDGRQVGALVLAHAQHPDDDLAVAFLIARQGRLGAAILLGLLTCVIASAWLAASFRRPVRQLAAGARALEAGRFDTRLPATRGDELGDLARSFNHLAARLDDAERARRQWMADTSHELRTPLAVLRAQLEALQDGVRIATPELLAAMHAQVLALARLVDDLQALTPAPLMPAPVDAWRVVVDAVSAFDDRLQAAGLDLSLGAAPSRSTVSGDADRLRQLAANLLENCARYTDAGGRIAIAATSAEGQLRITIDDTAPGVPPAALARLGERFFRVDASRSRHSGGSGLGLAVSREIAQAHAGSLAFAASPLGGLRAIVTLPLADRECLRPSSSSKTSPRWPHWWPTTWPPPAGRRA
jgi:two-component system sensor histidine kinase BaeS